MYFSEQHTVLELRDPICWNVNLHMFKVACIRQDLGKVAGRVLEANVSKGHSPNMMCNLKFLVRVKSNAFPHISFLCVNIQKLSDLHKVTS